MSVVYQALLRITNTTHITVMVTVFVLIPRVHSTVPVKLDILVMASTVQVKVISTCTVLSGQSIEDDVLTSFRKSNAHFSHILFYPFFCLACAPQ